MSLAWSSIKGSQADVHGVSISSSGCLDGNERRMAEYTSRYEEALSALKSHSGYDQYENSFLHIAEQIGEDGIVSGELSRMRFLSLKVHSEVLEILGRHDDALGYALQAWALSENQQTRGGNALLFRICKLAVKTDDCWTPKMVLTINPELVNGGILPAAVSKLLADMERVWALSSWASIANAQPSSSILDPPRWMGLKETKDNRADLHKCIDASMELSVVMPYVALGSRISVYWVLDAVWYKGVVCEMDVLNGTHTVLYDDDDHKEILILADQQWQLHGVRSPPVTAEVVGPSTSSAAPAYLCHIDGCSFVDRSSISGLITHIQMEHADITDELLSSMQISRCYQCNQLLCDDAYVMLEHTQAFHADSSADANSMKTKAPTSKDNTRRSGRRKDTDGKSSDAAGAGVASVSMRVKKALEGMHLLVDPLVEASKDSGEVDAGFSQFNLSVQELLRDIESKLPQLDSIRGEKGKEEQHLATSSRVMRVSLEEYLRNLQPHFCAGKAPTFQLQGQMFRAVAENINKFVSESHNSYQASNFSFPTPDLLANVIIGFALRVIRVSTNVASVFTTEESLVIFECMLDCLDNKYDTFVSDYGIQIDDALRVIDQFIVEYSHSILTGCLNSLSIVPKMIQLRYVVALCRLVKSSKLRRRVDPRLVVDIILLSKRLVAAVSLDSDLLLPHISYQYNIIDKNTLVQCLVEVMRQDELCRVEREVAELDSSVSDEDWLLRAIQFIDEIGQNIGRLVEKSVFKETVVCRAIAVANKLQDVGKLQRVVTSILYSVWSEYCRLGSSQSQVAFEILSLMAREFSIVDWADMRQVAVATLPFLQSIWLRSLLFDDLKVYSASINLLMEIDWSSLESSESIGSFFRSLLAHSVVESVFGNECYIVIGFYHMALQLSRSSITSTLPVNILRRIAAKLSDQMNVFKESNIMYHTACLEGLLFLTKLSAVCLSDENYTANLISLASALYEEYMSSSLFRFDSGAFGIRVQETVSCAVIDVDRLFREGYTPKDSLQVLKAGDQLIGLIYLNFYGFPFGCSTTESRRCLDLEVTDDVFIRAYNFLKYRESTGTLTKGEIRTLYHSLYRQPALQNKLAAISNGFISKYLFQVEGKPDDEGLIEVMMACRTRDAEENESSSTQVSTITDVFRSFFWGLIRTGISGDVSQLASESVAFSQRIIESYVRQLPVIEVLLCDVYCCANRFATWYKLLCEFVDLYFAIQDCIAENELLTNIPPECHEYDENVSLKYSISMITIPKRTSLSLDNELTDEFIIELLSRKRLLFQLILRTFRCLESSVQFSEAADDEGDQLTFTGCYEIMGNMFYQTALQFPKHSDLRRKYTQYAFNSFMSAAERIEGTGKGAFTFLMLGKLNHQLHQDIEQSLIFLDRAAKQDSSFVNNKPLKVALLYQRHSLRSKTATSYLITQRIPEEQVIIALERNSFSNVSDSLELPETSKSLENRLSAVLMDACLGLRDCRRLDPYDFKSVYRLAIIALKLSKSATMLHTKLPGSNCVAGPDSALEELSKLFDKKLPQVVAIWCLEVTANPIEQINQRTHKFEALRIKYLEMYIQLLELTCNFERFVDLVISVTSIKRKTAPVESLISVCFNRLLSLTRRCFSTSEDSAEELLGYMYDIHLRCKVYLVTKDPMFQQLETIMLQLCLPQFMVSTEVGTKRSSSVLHDIATADTEPIVVSTTSSFLNTSFSTVKEYCSRRWPDRLKRQSSLGATTRTQLQPQPPPQPHHPPLAAQSLSPNSLTKRQRALRGLSDEKDEVTTDNSCVVALSEFPPVLVEDNNISFSIDTSTINITNTSSITDDSNNMDVSKVDESTFFIDSVSTNNICSDDPTIQAGPIGLCMEKAPM